MSHNLLSDVHSFVFDKPGQRSIESNGAAIADRRRLQAHDRAPQDAAANGGAVVAPLEDQIDARSGEQPVSGSELALEVVRITEAADESLRRGGDVIALGDPVLRR